MTLRETLKQWKLLRTGYAIYATEPFDLDSSNAMIDEVNEDFSTPDNLKQEGMEIYTSFDTISDAFRAATAEYSDDEMAEAISYYVEFDAYPDWWRG